MQTPTSLTVLLSLDDQCSGSASSTARTLMIWVPVSVGVALLVLFGGAVAFWLYHRHRRNNAKQKRWVRRAVKNQEQVLD